MLALHIDRRPPEPVCSRRCIFRGHCARLTPAKHVATRASSASETAAKTRADAQWHAKPSPDRSSPPASPLRAVRTSVEPHWSTLRHSSQTGAPRRRKHRNHNGFAAPMSRSLGWIQLPRGNCAERSIRDIGTALPYVADRPCGWRRHCAVPEGTTRSMTSARARQTPPVLFVKGYAATAALGDRMADGCSVAYKMRAIAE